MAFLLIDFLGLVVFVGAVWIHWPVLKWYYQDIRKQFKD
jgi:hypothetical protein